MPKSKRKGKSDRDRNNLQSMQSSDDESMNDNASNISNYSDLRSVDENGDEKVDEISQQEAFEEKLTEALDGLTQKSAQGRTDCFEAVNKAFVKKYIPEYVYDRRMTVEDGIERGLRKGKGAEQTAAARLAPMLCVQLGAGDASDEVYKHLRPILMVTANDNSVYARARAQCCEALGLTTFLAGGEMGDVLNLMHQLESLFSGSYLKGDGSIPNISAEIAQLHASAISAWSLLFTLMSPGDVYSMMSNSNNFSPSIIQLSELLMSPHLEVRMAAGEALALVFEVGRDCDNDFAEEYVPDLVEALKQLATDSHKYRAKKDRKQQRATFRDVLNYIENDAISDVQIKFGQETLILDSWTKRKQYESLCHILGPGINIHLSENDLLRDIFQLGGRLLIGESAALKQTKQERHQMNAAAFKARTITRGKNRDKRSDF